MTGRIEDIENVINKPIQSGNVRVINLTYSELITLKEQVDNFRKSSNESKLQLHAKISLLIYKNQSAIDKKYFEYEKLRQQLLINNFKRDDDGEIVLNEEKQPTFKDNTKLDEQIIELLNTKISLRFVSPDMKNIERKVENLKGEESTLEQLWYLLDVFENFKA